MSQQQDRAEKLYPLQPQDDVSFAPGISSTGAQILLGVRQHGVLLVAFGHSGELIYHEFREHPMVPAKSVEGGGPGLASESLDRQWELLEAWKGEMSFTPSEIHVKQFTVIEWDVGIFDCPYYLHDYLDDPSVVTDFFLRQTLDQEIQEWQDSQQFILRWNVEYRVNGEGIVTGT